MSNNVNIFEVATRKSFRFNYKGVITTEDLWNLSLEQLNDIAVALYKQLQNAATVSFIQKPVEENEELTTKLEVVKHIIATKLEEKKNREEDSLRRQKKQQLLTLINQKENEQLSSLTVDELRKQLESL